MTVIRNLTLSATEHKIKNNRRRTRGRKQQHVVKEINIYAAHDYWATSHTSDVVGLRIDDSTGNRISAKRGKAPGSATDRLLFERGDVIRVERVGRIIHHKRKN